MKYGGHLQSDYLIFYLKSPAVYVLIIGGKDADTVMGEELKDNAGQIVILIIGANLAEVFSLGAT